MNAALRVPTLALLLALPLASARADGSEDGERGRTPPGIYIDECGGCHAPYPARGLPASSWRTLMTTLDRHFGSDASLAPAEAAVIRDWLLTNAGRHAAAGAPLRITRTLWFAHEHDEIPVSVWRSQAVGSAANCASCHRGADRGDFSERDIRLPRTSSPRLPTGATR